MRAAFQRWIQAYRNAKPEIAVQYQPIGSVDGIARLEAGGIDFAVTEIPLDREQLGRFQVKPLHFPVLAGAVVPVYNVPGAGELRFTGDALAGVFSGRIKHWNEDEIAKANPEAKLPDNRIVIIHRSDAAGTTYVLADLLAKISPAWKRDIGTGATVSWRGGESAPGDDELAELIRKTPNSMGYVDLSFAVEQKFAYGAVQNAAGKFVKAGPESLSAALAGADLDGDFRGSIVSAKAEGAYPIATVLWIVTPSHYQDPAKQDAMKAFLDWVYGWGRSVTLPSDYGTIPMPLADRARKQVQEIR